MAKPQPPPDNLPISRSASDPATPGPLAHYFALTLSLPERTARALSALVGGGTLLLTRTLVPDAIKHSSSYHFTLGMFQTFLIQNVAGMAQGSTAVPLEDRFVQRKLVGSSLEAAGLLTMHFSPVWVFAIASDAARGGQVFLQRLVHHLQQNGVIDQDSHPTTLEQLLLSVHTMSRQGATAIDTPPLSVQEIQHLADELRASAAHLTANSSRLLPRFESLWQQISQVARKENLSLSQLMGMLSIQAAAVSSVGAGTAGAVGKAGMGILDEMIIAEYKATLQGISEQGASHYLASNMRPFLDNARSHLNFKQQSSTQRWVHDRLAKFRAKLFPKK